MRILVLGGTGFIGPWVVRRLHEWGHEVTVCHRGKTEADLPPHLSWGGNTDQAWNVDSTRIRRELGYRKHVPQEEALRHTVAWERAHPPSQIDPAAYDYAAEDAALAGLE